MEVETMLLCKLVQRHMWQPNQFHPELQSQAAPYQCFSSSICKLFINKINFSNMPANQAAYTNPLQTSCLKLFSCHCCCEHLFFCNENRSLALKQYILFLSAKENSSPGSKAAFWHKYTCTYIYTCAPKTPEVCVFITEIACSQSQAKKPQVQNGEPYLKCNMKTTELDETNSLFGPECPEPNVRCKFHRNQKSG